MFRLTQISKSKKVEIPSIRAILRSRARYLPKQPYSTTKEHIRQTNLIQRLQSAFYPPRQPFNPDNGGIKKPWKKLVIGSMIAGIPIGVLYETFLRDDRRFKEITYQEFQTNLLNRGLVQELNVMNQAFVQIQLKPEAQSLLAEPANTLYFFSIGSLQQFERNLEKAESRLGLTIPVSYHTTGQWDNLALQLIPTFLLIGFFLYMGRRAFGKPVGKAKAHVFDLSQTRTKFKDVAGADEAKEEIMEFVKFLQNPERFERLGATMPKGAILSGPPGTGKTLMAKATAGEAGVAFLNVSGSEFVEMYAGIGPSRVRDLFSKAKENSPCILFIDEIDAIGKTRGGVTMNDERESTLNQLLVEMDGFRSSEGLVVLAGTNRPDVLDPALLRPGRFDRHVVMDRPDLVGRAEIFRVHLGPLRLDPELNRLDLAQALAVLTPGFSGADIHNICNEAALLAARHQEETIRRRHFEAAIERVMAGVEKKGRALSREEQRTVAYHEAGHAVAGWYLEHAEPLLKLSIIPRGSNALGYTRHLSKDQYLYSKLQLIDQMCVALAGRVSESIFFDTITTGAQDDLKKVTQMAYAQVTLYGMSELVGPVFYEPETNQTLQKPRYSEKTISLIDDEVRKMIGHAMERTTLLLFSKKQEIEKVAKALLEKEVLTREGKITYNHTNMSL